MEQFELYDEENTYLLIPGPIDFHPRIIREMAKKVYGHRTSFFRNILRRVHERLMSLFGLKNGEVLMLTGSGTLAMEAAVRSFSSSGSKILNFVVGKFSERFYEISKTVPHKELLTERYRSILEWGQVFTIERVKEIYDELEDDEEEPDIITFCHNETSTGVIHDIEMIAKETKKKFPNAILIVDGITSVGAVPISMEQWGVDVFVTGSQKCLETPPGLAFVALSQKAVEAIEKTYFENGKVNYDKLNGYYNHLAVYLNSWRSKKDLPFTGAVSLFYALDAALEMILLEGIERRYSRLTLMAKALRKAVHEWGLKLLLEEKDNVDVEKYASPTVTAIVYPKELLEKDTEFRSYISKFGVLIAGGQSKLKGRIFRVATMGKFGPRELIMAVGLIELALRKFGYNLRGSAVKAILDILLDGSIEDYL